MPDSSPPRCGAHGGSKKSVGAPKGNSNALKHGAYAGTPPDNLDKRITDLGQRIEQVGAYIDAHQDLDTDEFIKLHGLHAQMTSRLGRLKRDRQQVTGDQDDDLMQAMNEALDEAAQILGVEL